jgi:hypothetical protein
MRRSTQLILGLLLMPLPALSQAIDTNRPGFSFSPNTVAKGVWQLETGLDFTKNSSNSETVSLPAAEVRWGVAEQIEVFASGINWTENEVGDSTSSGFTDVNVGTKLAISHAEAVTKLAFLFQLSVPVGEDGFTSDRWDPTAAFIWSHGGGFPIAGTVKLSKIRSGFQLDNGLKLPFAINDRHTAFAEWEANLPEDGGTTHWLNGGYQYLIADQMQLDVNAGLGLNDRAGDYRLGVGFSYRF